LSSGVSFYLGAGLSDLADDLRSRVAALCGKASCACGANRHTAPGYAARHFRCNPGTLRVPRFRVTVKSGVWAL